MQLAIQETMLPGRSTLDRLEYAARLGLAGVEFDAGNLTARVPEVAAALGHTGITAAAVNLGRQAGYLSPEMAEREAAIGRLRQAMADAVDIGAAHVIFVPHFGGPRMPDLTPYRSPVELEGEMLVWLLRTVSDLAYAIGVELDILPVNRYETYFLNRLEQAVFFRRKIRDHPHVKIAAALFHMALEEADITAALRQHAGHIGYLYLADHNGRLPGQGMIDFAAVAAALHDGGYAGWLTLAASPPGENLPRLAAELPGSLDCIREAGL
jgi:sugar phosphate isomerase/epimerase